MEKIDIDGYRLEYDAQATRDCYTASHPHLCDCTSCRNFWAVIGAEPGERLRRYLDRFGIDVTKPNEVYDIAGSELDDGLWLYGGWYHFVGKMLETSPDVYIEDKRSRDDDGQMGAVALGVSSGDIRMYFHDSIHLMHVSFAGRPLVALEFEIRLPWVLGDASSG